MSAHTKKHHTNVVVDGRTFSVPKNKLKPLLSLVKDFEVTESIPWREVSKKQIKDIGTPAMALRGARLREGLTQVELAEKVNITQYNLSKMESGKRSIGKEMARRLAKALKTDHRVFL